MSVDPNEKPFLPRGVRLHFDKVRDDWVLLAPERAIRLDDIGLAILNELDGERSLSMIATSLAEKYGAPADQVATDCVEFLQSLVDRRFVELRQ
ncbi:pyrroloquinoline quinone biosynthesis peptide chaperone PqqD [Actibacterium lipolyticum]|uniref:PqqA binding protein n=1 Tax=Actibacterium lipolyticum TaxID=1524263 RepID=A0A238JNR8_9RHOB|nr:pyrroloquinoline quinone biosynthesis peptide chaperone PqqD [Actibacterium lipolyticum]SMX32328.1 Coenzyme PQQ synthesis protein D [Actibacterium lipolyticum]